MSTTPSESEWVLYHYIPNKIAAIVTAALFLLATLIYCCQVIFNARRASRKIRGFESGTFDAKTTLFGEKNNREKPKVSSTLLAFLPFFFGCIMEIVGYIGRAISSSNTTAIPPYIMQTVLLLVAPALYAATIYMVFGRMLHVMRCQNLMLISARFGTTFFVLGDILSFFLQAAGGGIMSKESGRKTGTNLIMAGLAVQIVFFVFFMINELRFTLRVKEVCLFYVNISKQWCFLNATLLLASVSIMIRSIVRLVEFAQGYDGFIISHEYFVYAFDALPMLLVVIFFSVGSFFGNIFDIIAENQSLVLFA